MNLKHQFYVASALMIGVGFAGGIAYGTFYRPLKVHSVDLNFDNIRDAIVEDYKGNYSIFMGDRDGKLTPLNFNSDKTEVELLERRAQRFRGGKNLQGAIID